ncbi:MAG: hypothetical protein WC525_05340 [Candidatus Thermoplasmatota archaeon]
MGGNHIRRKAVAVSIIFFVISISVIPSTANMMTLKDDTTPPITTCTLNPPDPDGQNGWYINNVTVTLSTTDNESGVNVTYYRVNTTSWEIYIEPFILSNDGCPILIEYYSIDNAGNEETPKSVVLKIDKTPPTVGWNIAWEKVGDQYYIIITVTSYDNMSGMSKVEFYFNDLLQETVTGAGPGYSWSFQYVPLPVFTIKVIIYDSAGHTSVVEITIRHETFFAGVITDVNNTGDGIISFKAKYLWYVIFQPFEIVRVPPNAESYVLQWYHGYLGPRAILGLFTGIWVECS